MTCLAVFRQKWGGQAISELLYPYFSMEIKKNFIGKVEEETQMSKNQKKNFGYLLQLFPEVNFSVFFNF